ncbi:MarR family winged helix-turn-helix transcriptional regulator [Nocardia cyriacigeorgica]|uniref:MarR family winged helix-turn-helix transcriptional regulator n=1 Tax=Nocardia cyriacigeorgica TaxID=135487 RepID=UPI0013D3C8A0|nr:MarR family transcriptional regulator [Nocardia cyriacigeorgica]NEW26876.1 MarR family transcriptional regulator [Nocardia cyriacigeorgica]
MSTTRPITDGSPRPSNTAVLLRDAFTVLNDLALARLAAAGHEAIRAAHGVVFQHLDDTGTTVSALAERAQMTKQAMAELVAHLEAHAYVTREPDPSDRRAKLVVPTDRGKQVIAIAQSTVPAVEEALARLLGADDLRELRANLEAIIESADSLAREVFAARAR